MNKRDYTPNRSVMKPKTALTLVLLSAALVAVTVQGLSFARVLFGIKLAVAGHVPEGIAIMQQFIFAALGVTGVVFFTQKMIAGTLVALSNTQRDQLLREVQEVTKGHLAKNKERELLNLAEEKREKKTRAAIYRTAPKKLNSRKPWQPKKAVENQAEFAQSDNYSDGYAVGMLSGNTEGYSLSIKLD